MPSRLIAAFDYNAEQQSLDISFLTGRRYRYFAVPPETAAQMRAAFSKGSFFNHHIRGHFAHQELPALTDPQTPVRSR